MTPLHSSFDWQLHRLTLQLSKHAYQPVSSAPVRKVVQFVPDPIRHGQVWAKCVCGRRCLKDRSRCNRCRQADRRIANRVGWHMPVPRSVRGASRLQGPSPTTPGNGAVAPRQVQEGA